MFRGILNDENFGITQSNVTVGPPGRDVFQIKVQRYTSNTTGTVDVGVRRAI